MEKLGKHLKQSCQMLFYCFVFTSLSFLQGDWLHYVNTILSHHHLFAAGSLHRILGRYSCVSKSQFNYMHILILIQHSLYAYTNLAYINMLVCMYVCIHDFGVRLICLSNFYFSSSIYWNRNDTLEL